jgi:phenylpropionate dioxygenase-like ring-hydroxylating dioxygenase large terminal subunit
MPIKTDPVNRLICTMPYAVVERHGFVWIWIGNRDRADAATVPDLWMCDRDRGWVADGGSYHVRCDYRYWPESRGFAAGHLAVKEGSGA